jgi:hypothetical protein
LDGRDVLEPLGWEHFERDDLVELGVQRFIDRPHTTFAQFAEQLILAERLELGGWISRLIFIGHDRQISP